MKYPLLILSVALSMCTYGQHAFHPGFDTSKILPVNHLEFKNDPENFQFAIVSDRTGGHRPGVFMDAVNKLNLLQPEFVMSVGDLIEGYTVDTNELNHQWDEFDRFVDSLQMPFFYLPGNHDITNQIMEGIWKRRLGPTYYHFVYRDVLFLCLNSEDQRRGAGRGTFSQEQFDYASEVLEDNDEVRWTLVFMHQPLWHQKETELWPRFEELLAQRSHTVFAGHEHRYVKEQRNSAHYFTLATTGGGSSLRGPQLGEFDHLVWVTMTEGGPVIANLLLDGIWRDDVVTRETKDLINELGRNNPFQVLPPFRESGRKEYELTLKITNDFDLPMQLQFKANSSPDLALFAPEGMTIPPNSVKNLQLPLLLRSPDPISAASLKTELKLQAPGEPVKMAMPYHFKVKPLKSYRLERINRPVEIDARLDEWDSLPYHFKTEQGATVRFEVAYDEDFLYFAAQVEDDQVINLGDSVAVWRQDNVAFGFNAEKLGMSAMSTGRRWYRYEFMQLISPETDLQKSSLYRAMPEGSAIKCSATEKGYQAELKVPLSYVEAKQGKDWKHLRINVAVDDRDSDGEVRRNHWQPSWRSDDNIIGSGTFKRGSVN